MSVSRDKNNTPSLVRSHHVTLIRLSDWLVGTVDEVYVHTVDSIELRQAIPSNLRLSRISTLDSVSTY